MNRHIATEQLSAYLDAELGLAEMRQLEAHCAACAECGARLASLRRVVAGLGRVERAAPPPELRQQIRRQAVNEVPAHGIRGALEALRLIIFPAGPALRTAAAMGLALVVGLFGVNHGVGRDALPPQEPALAQEVVTVKAGAPPLAMLMTTSEVAGREFIWTESGWVQRGLEWETPAARVDARSPRGREMLTRHSDLGLLLADGSPVVLRYQLQTVEIRNTRSSRRLGFNAQPRPEGRRPGRAVAA
jgi:hypothetical protein